MHNFNNPNVTCYLVGGAVRDMLMGRDPKDRDYVVVGATPQFMIEQGFQQVGAAFPVFLHPETGEEYALARREKKVAPGYTGFEFEFGPDITLEDDLIRRDLTINSIAFVDGKFFDPFGGMDDINNKIVRHTSEAFAEDPLRVIRAARFISRYEGFEVDPDTVKLCKTLVERGEIDALSPERIWTEMEKLFSEKRPSKGTRFLRDVGAFHTNALKPFSSYTDYDLWIGLFKKDIEPSLTFAEKMFSGTSIHSLSKKEANDYRIPTHVWREAKFFEAFYGDVVLIDFSFEEMVSSIDHFREELKAGQLTKMIDFARKTSDLDDQFENMFIHYLNDKTEDMFTRLTKAIEAVINIDFTDLVKGMKPADIKSFVSQFKLKTFTTAFNA